MQRVTRLIVHVLFYAALGVFLVVVLLPIYYIWLPAFEEGGRFYSTPLNYFPDDFTLDRFRYAFRDLPVLRYMLNTVFLATTSTVIALIISFLAAYAIARIRFPGANAILVGLLLSSVLPWSATVVPLFDLYQKMRLMDTLHGLLLLYVSALLPLTVWVLVSFIRQIPREIEDAARVDGASLLRLIRHIVAPMAGPGIATMFGINFIVSWNEFFIPLIFARGPKSKVINSALVEQYAGNLGMMSTISILSTIPVFAVTLLLQRRIMEGIVVGAIK